MLLFDLRILFLARRTLLYKHRVTFCLLIAMYDTKARSPLEGKINFEHRRDRDAVVVGMLGFVRASSCL